MNVGSFILNFLIRSFRRLAGDGNQLSRDGFIRALQDIKMTCSEAEADEIFRAVDTDGMGHIDMNEFLFQLRSMSSVNMSNRTNSLQLLFTILLLIRCGKSSFENVLRSPTLTMMTLLLFVI